MKLIDTENFSSKLRGKAINIPEKSVLVTNFNGSLQEQDLAEPANCDGFGRIRHFKLGEGRDWPINPLPTIPVSKALGIEAANGLTAQVFQNSVCNWRCWYCYVDFKLLSGNSKYASFKTCDELLDLYLKEPNRPRMIDLSGGQPDLTPEWIPWMMESLIDRGLEKKIYLWSDDNLSNDFFWRYLSDKQQELIASYKLYSRVGCFKGIDPTSFSLNTNAKPELFDAQFDLCKRLLHQRIDLYFYITLTAESNTNFEIAIPKFLDRLQDIHELLPLRTVPLRVSEFTPVEFRMTDQFRDMLAGQYLALSQWNIELSKRYPSNVLNLSIDTINLNLS